MLKSVHDYLEDTTRTISHEAADVACSRFWSAQRQKNVYPMFKRLNILYNWVRCKYSRGKSIRKTATIFGFKIS